jgi:hypothetical protein
MDEPGYTFPNKMGRIVLLALEEVMGRNGLNAVLNLARLPHLSGNYPPPDFKPGVSFDEMSRLLGSIDEMYGPRGGRMLHLRAGRACFSFGVKDLGGLLGLADVAFRVVPLEVRMRVGIEVLAEIMNRYSDQQIRLAAEEENFLWVTEHCGVCWERTTTYPACAMMVGLLQEAMYWVSGGRRFDVQETTCLAMGDETCTIALSKVPLI